MVDQIAKTLAQDETGIDPVIPIPPASGQYLWFSGRRLPWSSAVVHVTMVGWPALSAVFEGIRAYWNADQGALYIFRLPDHLKRLENSIRLQRMKQTFDSAQLTDAILDLTRANECAGDTYIQPMAFATGASWGSRANVDSPAEITIITRPSDTGLLSGRTVTAGVTSWMRIDDQILPPRIKAVPNYANSRLASYEASRHGYDAPVFLNRAGKVAESSGSCIALVRNGIVITPPVTASILESITRESLIELLRDSLGVTVLERDVDRTELYAADEVFLCGTAMEVTPVSEIDGFQIGAGRMGPVTTRLERLYHDVVRGIDARYKHWLTRV